MAVINGVFCLGYACDIQTRAAFQSSRLTGARLRAVVTLQTLWWETGGRSMSWNNLCNSTIWLIVWLSDVRPELLFPDGAHFCFFSTARYKQHCARMLTTLYCALLMPWSNVKQNKKSQLSLGKTCYNLYSPYCSADLQCHPRSIIFMPFESRYATSY